MVPLFWFSPGRYTNNSVFFKNGDRVMIFAVCVAVQASNVEVYNRACRPLCVLDNVVREPSGHSRPGGLASA